MILEEEEEAAAALPFEEEEDVGEREDAEAPGEWRRPQTLLNIRNIK